MRYYVVMVVLLSLLAAAQEVNIYATVMTPQQKNVYLNLYEDSSVSYSLGQEMLVQDLTLEGQYYCADYSTSYICMYFDDNSDDVFCAPLDQYKSGFFSIPHLPTMASSITFFYQGTPKYCSWSVFQIRSLSWLGGSGEVFSRNLYSVDTSSYESLGKISSFMDAGGKTVFTNTSDPRLVSWFSEQGILSSTSTKSTNNPSDELVICTNFDLNKDVEGNPICDFVDNQECVLKGSEWLMGDCCGDSPYSACEFHSDKQAICGRNYQNKLRWASLSRVGEIVDLTGCPGVEVVSNGSVFFTCGEVPSGFSMVERFQGIKVIAGREYMCIGDRMVECGGDSPISGKSTGDKQVVGSTVYYCSGDATWEISLDDSEYSCEEAGLAWTGTKCCGEVSDSLETYEDSGGSGSCYKNNFVASGRRVPGTRDHISYNGFFHVCSTSSQLFNGTGISPAEVAPCSPPLPNALSGSEPHALCMPWGDWRFVGNTSARFRKDADWPVGVGEHKEGCCTEGECWDGDSCVKRGTVMTKGGKGFRCE